MKKGMNHDIASQELTEKYEAMIQMLENRVQEEMAKNRQKDQMLIQQAKLAAMGEILTGIGHQWRLPLNHLSLLIQDIRDVQSFGEMNDQYMDQFANESMILIDFLTGTIQDFRKFYRPSKEKCAFSMAESIEAALSIFSYFLKKHEIHVYFEYREQQKAYGYPNEFSQAVLNLFINIRDAFVKKEINDRKLFITINESSGHLIAEIIDNAGGAEPELLSKMFDANDSAWSQDTILGLFITKVILESMNGSITADNVGDGIRYHLSVPKITSVAVSRYSQSENLT
ncbi:HAMP domain-containing sensor histidine kinase [Neobacillus niacini]|uniref:sensor histidine kinase n=1 Tax=Neobacillus niacini TaxID=86668 RepID=UPI00286141E3|nr:HAMP domain-containing sensor histidine kinase [Neobacillus niacini]MDR7001717.1 phosphoglycerate-specific signal transduction histidine kinase [Neobacillus niacini]